MASGDHSSARPRSLTRTRGHSQSEPVTLCCGGWDANSVAENRGVEGGGLEEEYGPEVGGDVA